VQGSKEGDENSGVPRLLAIGSILHYARQNDIVWGSGINGNHLAPTSYRFSHIDIRAVRGPLTARYVTQELGLLCPEIFGDPALLMPWLFPEFRREKVRDNAVVIPHFTEKHFFSSKDNNVLFPDEHHWLFIMERILSASLVVSSSLHGIIVAEAFGVPARMLRITDNEAMFKYEDYYEGTGRDSVRYAKTVNEALELGGERPVRWNPLPLLEAFPVDKYMR
jgi:pyruvyltransferase